MSDVAITTLDVPQSFCFQSWQSAWPTLVGLIRGSVEVGGGINFGNTTPAPEDRDKPWFRTNADGTPDKLYSFASGNWLALHPVPPGLMMLYDGSSASIVTLDGGENAPVTTTTGPMWERVTAFDAKFPLGVGTLGDGTVVNVGDTGGSQEVTLALENIPAHDHGLPNRKVMIQTLNAGNLAQSGGDNVSVVTFQSEGGNPDGSTEPHGNMPPWRGTFFIRRTARLYYRL